MLSRLQVLATTTRPLARTPLARVPVRALAARAYSASTAPAPTRACPSCGAAIPLPASPCPKCDKLIPIPAGLSLHSLLAVSDPAVKAAASEGSASTVDIPVELATLPAHGYDLDARDLRNRMLRRQQALHPDRWGQQGDEQNDLAADLSARINRAYEVLANPLRRAEYILEQYGKDTQEQDKLERHDLLVEILEAREELEDTHDRDQIQDIYDDNHAKVLEVEKGIKEAFSKDPPDIHAAKELAVELKYWLQLEEAAKDKL